MKEQFELYCRVFCNLADNSNVKTNQENMPTAKKNYTHVAIQVQAFWRKP